MVIDFFYCILIVLAIIKGFRRGFIVAIFSFFAVIIALAAAIKLSVVTANWIGKTTNSNSAWLPFIAFAIVFIGFVFLIRLVANIIQKSAEAVMLGMFNKIGGILLYACIYTMVFSIILFYATQIHFIQPETVKDSKTYGFIEPWGPTAINTFGEIIPWFKNLFLQLQKFFENIITTHT
ncbi:MAG: CvpA family protein [Bacteroidetes bacterium]|nr:CvpA family protein [Bacteroidota bacterium]MBS1591931.1 CvpA family protein [Bacteroidota bacterium]